MSMKTNYSGNTTKVSRVLSAAKAILTPESLASNRASHASWVILSPGDSTGTPGG